MSTFTVYQLIDPRTQQPCYVGYTDDYERRRQDYLNWLPHSKAMRRWFSDLKSAGLRPIMSPLEIVEGTREDALLREAYWINELIRRGAILYNVQGNSARQARRAKTILLETDLAFWLKMRAIDERREMSEIVDDALELYKEWYQRKQ